MLLIIQLLCVNAVTFRREFKLLLSWVACVLLLYLDNWIGIIWGLFHFTVLILVVFLITYIRFLVSHKPPQNIYASGYVKAYRTGVTGLAAIILLYICTDFFYLTSQGFADYLSGYIALVTPVKIYSNADTQKETIIKENQGKSGVYRWTNKVTGNIYVGSGVDLSKRLSGYYSYRYLKTQLKKGKSAIYSAILKYGLSNFSLEILEYCSLSDAVLREQYYLDWLNPEYNLLRIAGSTRGQKHSEETRKKISDAMGGENNPMFGKNHSDETRKKISGAKLGQARPEGSGRPSQQILVIDKKTNLTTTYESITAAARALNIHKSVIDKYFSRNQQKPYKGRYTFAKI